MTTSYLRMWPGSLSLTFNTPLELAQNFIYHQHCPAESFSIASLFWSIHRCAREGRSDARPYLLQRGSAGTTG